MVSCSAVCSGPARKPKNGTRRFWLVEKGIMPDGLHQGIADRSACRTSIPLDLSMGRTPAISNSASSGLPHEIRRASGLYARRRSMADDNMLRPPSVVEKGAPWFGDVRAHRSKILPRQSAIGREMS